MQLLHNLVPTANIIAVLVNPADPTRAETIFRDLQVTARTLGLQLHVLHASTDRELETVFANLAEVRAGGLLIGGEPFFNSRIEQLGALTLRHSVPTIYQFRAFAVAGGLASYGGSLTDAYRLAGVYSGRILKGEKPADLPVQRAAKFELIINLKTAKALDLTVPRPPLRPRRRGDRMRRREFVAMFGAATAAWPLAARAQQSAMPVVGFLNGGQAETFWDRVAGFHRGLKETGFTENQNVTIEYRWASGRF